VSTTTEVGTSSSRIHHSHNKACVNDRKRRIVQVLDENSEECWDDDVRKPQPKHTMKSRVLKHSKPFEVAPVPDSTTLTICATIEALPSVRPASQKPIYVPTVPLSRPLTHTSMVTSTIQPATDNSNVLSTPAVLVTTNKLGRLVVRISSPEMAAADHQLHKLISDCEPESHFSQYTTVLPSTDSQLMISLENSETVIPAAAVVAVRKRGRPPKLNKPLLLQPMPPCLTELGVPTEVAIEKASRGRPKKGAASALAYAQSVMLPRWIPASPLVETKVVAQPEEKVHDVLVEQKSELLFDVSLKEQKSVLVQDIPLENKSELIVDTQMKAPLEIILDTLDEKKSDFWSIEVEARHHTVNMTYNVNDLQLLSDCKPLYSSTPIKDPSRPTTPTQLSKKSRLRIRFRPCIIELSAMEDADMIPSHAVLANYVAPSTLLPSAPLTSALSRATVGAGGGEGTKRPRRAGMNIDELLRIKERELGVVETACTTDILKKPAFVTKASMKRYNVEQKETTSFTKKRRVNRETEGDDYNMSDEDKENTIVTKRRVHFTVPVEKSLVHVQQLQAIKQTVPYHLAAVQSQVPRQTVEPVEPRTQPHVQPPHLVVQSQPAHNTTQSHLLHHKAQSQVQPLHATTVQHASHQRTTSNVPHHTVQSNVPLQSAPTHAPTHVIPAAHTQPPPTATILPVSRALNGERVSVLMDLQQRLSTITDLKLLRRIVQIIEETGQYRLNDVTFDFDLCKLDLVTVKRLHQCLVDYTSDGPAEAEAPTSL